MSKSLHPIFNQIKNDRPPIHVKQDGSYRCVGLNSDALDFLFSTLKPGMATLETGCGLSTLLFALAGCNHTAIVPNIIHIKETQKNAENYHIKLDNTAFVEKRSEFYLPGWSSDNKLDVILIDGGHAFPLPMIDWFYTQKHLNKMGLLILDDIGLKSVNVLFEFLNKQPQWQIIHLVHKTAFFRKLSEQSNEDEWDYWKQQPFNQSLDSKLRQLYYSAKHKFHF